MPLWWEEESEEDAQEEEDLASDLTCTSNYVCISATAFHVSSFITLMFMFLFE